MRVNLTIGSHIESQIDTNANRQKIFSIRMSTNVLYWVSAIGDYGILKKLISQMPYKNSQ